LIGGDDNVLRPNRGATSQLRTPAAIIFRRERIPMMRR
jgi:hypothetical protein